jgi:hypothetical protein
MLEPVLLALAFAIGLIVLVPARRLQLAGFSRGTIAIYAVVLWLLGFLLAVRPIGARFLIPILLIAYIAPFVTAPAALRRIVRRGEPSTPTRPMKNVTPPEEPDRRD